MKVLLIGEERKLLEHVARNLRAHGHAVRVDGCNTPLLDVAEEVLVILPRGDTRAEMCRVYSLQHDSRSYWTIASALDLERSLA